MVSSILGCVRLLQLRGRLECSVKKSSVLPHQTIHAVLPHTWESLGSGKSWRRTFNSGQSWQSFIAAVIGRVWRAVHGFRSQSSQSRARARESWTEDVFQPEQLPSLFGKARPMDVAKCLARDAATVSTLVSRFAVRMSENNTLRKRAMRLAVYCQESKG